MAAAGVGGLPLRVAVTAGVIDGSTVAGSWGFWVANGSAVEVDTTAGVQLGGSVFAPAFAGAGEAVICGLGVAVGRGPGVQLGGNTCRVRVGGGDVALTMTAVAFT